MSENFQIVDLREKYFKVSNRIFDHKLDAYEVSIYCLLCRYADNDTTESFPSISNLSNTLSISKPKVISTIKSLVDKGIVYKKQGDRVTSNKYYLMSLTTQREKVVNEVNHPSKQDLPGVVNEVNTKKTNLKTLNKNTQYIYTSEDWNNSISKLKEKYPKCEISILQSLNTSRMSKLKLRIKEGMKIDKIFEKVYNSSFLLYGSKNQSWRFNFDWLTTNPNNWVKVMEGQYDNRNGSAKKKSGKTYEERIEAQAKKYQNMDLVPEQFKKDYE